MMNHVNMPLCASTGPVLDRCIGYRTSTGPVLAHNGMFMECVELWGTYNKNHMLSKGFIENVLAQTAQLQSL